MRGIIRLPENEFELETLVRDRADEITQYLAGIVDSSDDAIISIDVHGIITSWNKSAERLFGYTFAEAVGKPITMLIPRDRQGEERAILERVTGASALTIMRLFANARTAS